MRSGSRCPAFYGEIPPMRWGILDDDSGYFYCITYNKVFLEGQVKKILPSGRSGFIDATDGKSYFFAFADVRIGRKHLTEGSSVRFTLAKRMDRKKNRLSDNAVEITVEQNQR